MAVDTPATIAILGAGPMGIETGLYARYLGYDVTILEAREVGAHVRAWGHLQMFSPFRQLRSSLGLAALRAQDPEYRPPETDAHLTGREWVERYVLPLSQTDLLADHIQVGTRVVAVGRQQLLKNDPADDEQRGDDGFRLLVQRADGQYANELADIVIDCTGVYGNPGWCGAGGIPARGELRLHHRIEHGVPDILGAMRSHYEGRRILVVGDGLAAAATVVALAKVAQREAGTQVTWIIHRLLESAGDLPIPEAECGQLPARQQLAQAANACAESGMPWLDFRPGTCVDSMDFDDQVDQFLVQFDAHASPEKFDRVIADVGYRPDRSLYEELRVVESPRTGGPLSACASPADATPADPTHGTRLHSERFLTTEPNFYVLGAKSFGRDSRFVMADGLCQIRSLFGLIGGRGDLDLYATAEKLAQ